MTCLSRKPGAGQLPVRVKAAGVGNCDALIREGKVELQSLPIILGSELSTAENWLRTSALCSRWRTRASPTRCLPAARIAAEDHARYRFPTLGTVEYSGAKVDQGFEAAAGFVDLNTRARKDGHATLDHDIQASLRCRCRPGGSRGGRRGRRRRRDGQAGCNARADAIHSLVLSIVLLAGVIFGIGVEAKRKRELEPWRARIRLIGTLPSGRRFYSWCEAGRTSIGPRLKPQDGKSHNKERTASDRQLCYCLVGFSALADPLGPRQRRRGKQRRRGQQ